MTQGTFNIATGAPLSRKEIAQQFLEARAAQFDDASNINLEEFA